MMDKKSIELKKIIEDNLQLVKEMSVEEYTLYRKWMELNEREWTPNEQQRMWEVKNTIWVPEEPDDYLKLEPVVIHADSKDRNLTWDVLRRFISTANWSQNPGRSAKYFIIDNKTKRHLGVMSLGSDFIAIGGRDEYVGWTLDRRLKEGALNYTAMGNTIVPTQPLGYNYTGGKLISLLLLSDVVQNSWNVKYPKEKLVAITTTSLYGGLSQYNRLKYWRQCKSTEGEIPIEPTNEVYQLMRDWIRERFPDKLSEIELRHADGQIPTHPKIKVIQFVYSQLKIKSQKNNAPRGVYFADLYSNTKAFLKGDSKEWGEPLFPNSCKALFDLWKERYAANRIKNVVESKRYNTDKLFYDNIIGMSWQETKEKYLSNVGR